MVRKSMITENSKQNIVFMITRLATFFSMVVLLLVFIFIFIEGAGVINSDFLTKMWSHRDIRAGGIFPAIVGSVCLGIGVAIASIPIGIGTAIYLNEYAKNTLFTRSIKLAIRNLAGIPSIIYGLFGLSFFVMFLQLGTSLVAASLTLGVMTLPWIITASEEALKAVPHSFREGSYALGASKWQTIQGNVLPHSWSGMLTGSILGISRAMGETAPIIVVGATFFISYLPTSPFDKFMALPYHTFILATQHSSQYAQEYALGTALVLICLTFILNVGVFILRYKLRRKKEW